MKLESLHDLFLDELRDLYDAETQLAKALPKMARSASCEELAIAFEVFSTETGEQHERLRYVFTQLKARPTGRKCKAMTAMIEEGKDTLELIADRTLKDAALIATMQKIKHYEIAGHDTLRKYAELLGYYDACNVLEYTLSVEDAAGQKLTELAHDIGSLAQAPA